jgi:hypothetical protein
MIDRVVGNVVMLYLKERAPLKEKLLEELLENA